MKIDQARWLFWAFLASGLLGCVVPAGQAQEALSLQGAARRALTSHPAIEAAAATEREAAAETREAQSGYMPRLSWTESYTRSNNPVFVFGSLLNQKKFGQENFAISSLNNPDALNNFQSLVRVEQTVYDARRTKHAVRAAKLAQELNAETRRSREADVLFQVARTYFGVALAERGLAVAEETVRSVEADLRRAETVFASGLGTRADVMSVRVHLGAAEQQRIQAESDAAIARAALNDALGLDLGMSWSLATPLTLDLPPGAESLDQYLRSMLQHRPELRAAALGEQISAARTVVSKRSIWPEVVAQGVFETDRQRFASQGGGNWLAGVAMKWDLWHGGANRARIAASQEAEIRAAAESRQAYSAAALEVRRTHTDLGSATQRAAVAASVVEEAEESLRIMRDRYEVGLEEVTALLQTEVALTNSRYRQLATAYEQRVALAALEHAAGTLTIDSEALR